MHVRAKSMKEFFMHVKYLNSAKQEGASAAHVANHPQKFPH